MVARLQPLYDLLSDTSSPRTLREQAFEDAFKSDLLAAWRLVSEYERSGREQDMLRAWDYYRRCYAKIDQQFDKLRDLDLQYVSPWLKGAHDLRVVMPGTYIPNGRNVRIWRFNPSLSVLDTAQRPRKLTILGLFTLVRFCENVVKMLP